MREPNIDNRFQKQPGRMPGSHTLDGPAVYEIMVGAVLSDQWADWFDGLELIQDEQENTCLRGILVDQAALYGVLGKIRDLNLILLSLRRM